MLLVCLLSFKAVFPSLNHSTHSYIISWGFPQKEREREVGGRGEPRQILPSLARWMNVSILEDMNQNSSFLSPLIHQLDLKRMKQPDADLTGWSNSFVFSFAPQISD